MSPIDTKQLSKFCESFPSITICSQNQEEVSDSQILNLLSAYLTQDNLFKEILSVAALMLVCSVCICILWCVCQFLRFIRHSRPHVAQEGCCSKFWRFLKNKTAAAVLCLFCHDRVHVDNALE